MRHLVKLFGLALVVISCGPAGAVGFSVITSGAHVLEGEHPTALLIMGGEVTVAEGAALRNSAWLVEGALVVAGAVEQDLSILGGSVAFEPGSSVGGDLNLAGGSAEGVEAVAVGGQITDQMGIDVPLTPGWQRDQPTAVQLAVIGGQTLAFAGLAFLFGLLFGRPLQRVERALAGQPLVSLALGLLGALVLLPLLVFMAFTIVLIPVAVAGLILLGLAVAYGWAALGLLVLRRVARPAGAWPLPIVAALGAGGLSLLAQVLTFVPLVGAVAAGLLVVSGLGAVLYTRFGSRAAMGVSA